MFIRQTAQRVFIYNDNMDIVKEFDNAKFSMSDSRVVITSADNPENVLCDMPSENTSILYR